MAARFTSSSQGKLFRAVRIQLYRLGYRDDLLTDDYTFSDWFLNDTPERTVPAAAFGQTPPSYDTSCFAVLLANHRRGVDLVQEYRALGAPFALEIAEESVSFWLVGRDSSSTRLVEQFTIGDIDAVFQKYTNDWRPDSVLRAKNIASKPTLRQLELFDYGLVPELEHKIRDKLDPLVRDACAAAVGTYRKTAGRDPDPRQLFRLAFWLLAGKVFRDRHIHGFSSLAREPSADDVLVRVAKHYKERLPRLLNHPARDAVHKKIWSGFDFRNLSIDVLTHIWTNTFVSQDIRKKLGIHPTPRTIAKYIVDSLPFEDIAPQDRFVLEPCCGSATFLVAALQRLRDQPNQKQKPEERHKYLQDHLIGFERESFGVEISRLCLTLADFPNPNGWQLHEQDVFASADFRSELTRARIVLCNPPFEDFVKGERDHYTLTSIRKPVALLDIVLSNLHADGIIGFVLPRLIIDGDGYKQIRNKLAQRFANLDVVTLPDKAFETSDQETAILLASKPRKAGAAESVTVTYSQVAESDWNAFKTYCGTTSSASETKTIIDATERLTVPQLRGVWSSTKSLIRLGKIAEIHRGLEWTLRLTQRGRETGNRELLVRTQQEHDCRLGLPPKASPFFTFQSPSTAYLRMRPQDERGHSYDKPWENPKVIMNKATRSRGHWRISAFPDYSGLVFYQTFTGIWPNDPAITKAIAAVLNGPVANAFVSTIEGKVDITSDTLAEIPIPYFQPESLKALDALIVEYTHTLQNTEFGRGVDILKADVLLRQIDALVLRAYDLSPRHERELLDYFNGERRIVPFPFDDYFPKDFEPCFSLSEYLSEDFQRSTAAAWRSRFKRPPDHVLAALREAARSSGE